jgi:metal-dependent amidase/aminoacylase/carboxypeptidase family protein
MTVDDEAAALQDTMVRLRRELHADPEVGLSLPRTQRRVLDALADLPLDITTGTTSTSVVAVLRGEPGGRAVLLRGDMDALPVVERTGLPFAATGETMHACGHDLHTAMLVGAAHLLCARRDQLPGDGRGGTAMAAVDTLYVTVKGAGGHGSAPHRAKDPIPPACEMVTALQALVTRRFDVFDPAVVTVGSFHAGTADNVIPDTATFEATLRSFSREAQARLTTEVTALCRGIAAAHGLEVEAVVEPGYPVTVNSAEVLDLVRATIGTTLGDDRWIDMPNPITGSEDFCRVLDEVPGVMVFLGAVPPGVDPDTAPDNHSPEAVFDESVLATGAAVHRDVALAMLRG